VATSKIGQISYYQVKTTSESSRKRNKHIHTSKRSKYIKDVITGRAEIKNKTKETKRIIKIVNKTESWFHIILN
jgi:alpha-L-arabinofuranosidase